PLCDQGMLTIDLAPLRGVRQFDDYTVTGAGSRRNVARHLDRHLALVSGGDADHLTERFAVSRRAADQLIKLTHIGQQRLQCSAWTVPRTDAKQIFGAGIEVDDGAVGIDDQYACG
ncbi:MAG: hypothetical protein Q8N51_19245, partial [Gammaproteobacteria bacterium]|nr:hypothetical protein [Gammaproteobacteria bacterium]